MAYAQILQRLLQRFFVTMGRAPLTPNEWSKLRKQAMDLARKEGGDPITGAKISPQPELPFDTTKDLPTTGILQKRGNIIPFPKSRKSSSMKGMSGKVEDVFFDHPQDPRLYKPGIQGLMKKGDVRLGQAPKTKKSTLDRKKSVLEGQINKEMWIKQKQQENRDAIRRFKEKNPKTVEDFRDKDDWDPYGMAGGGIAPLVGEPSYAADFYDDRTPMKKGRKVKKKKLTAAEKRKREEEEHKEILKELIKKMPREFWRMRPSGKQRYKKKSDLPEGILEILEKDPGFDFEDFAKIYWSPEGAQWTDEGFSRGQLGSYSGMTGNIELGLAPFGKKKYKEWELGKPHLDPTALTDRDKATIALHELRHKNILENRELFEAQPEWVKSIEGPGYLPKGGTTGHELYDRFLDKRFNPTISDPGRHDPYFDKILRDYWEPYAQEYENIAGRLKSEKRGEGIETLAAQGGRIGMAGGGALFKFIEKLFIKASNDIRLGRGKWKGLDQKQRIVQHDNLTKKVVEFEKTGNTEGLEIYFDVNPHEAFAAAQAKATRLGKKGPNWKEQEVQAQMDEAAQGGVDMLDERGMLKQKYPGISDDLVEKILVDDNPQRKADVMGTIDNYMKLREVGKSEAEAYDIITKSFSKNPTKHAEGGRIGFNPGGPVDQEALIQLYLAEGLSYEEAVQAAQSATNLPWDTLKKAEGGRAEFIFGGSAGLRAMWKQMMKGISERRGGEPVKRLFPGLSARDKAIEKVVIGTPEQKAFRAREKDLKIEGIDLLINRLKNDKKIIERKAKNKKIDDPGLNFLMKKLEENMSEAYTPHLKKYTDIDKDILDMETIKKNFIMKDRKLNAYGGRVSYSRGGLTGLPAVTMGTPQMNMQGPQMPAGPQPAGIPGGTIVAQNQMQQAPWMGPQMQQGIGGMPRPQPQGQPRMPFGLGGMSRRAFMKLMAGITALPFVGKGITKVAPKAVKETAEVIARGPDGMPAYITDLIEVVKAKGTRDIIEGFKKSDYSTVHRYKGVEVIEDAAGNTKIKSDLGGVATDPHTGKMHEGIAQEHHMQIERGEWIEPTKTKKGIKTQDEYIEGTVRPDMDGKMKDFEEGLDEAVHSDFKKIADELHEEGFYYPLDAGEKLKGKASGGLAYALGE